MNEHTRTLALLALRPTKDSVAVSLSRSSGGGGRSEKSRYYRALWRYAVEVVLRVSAGCVLSSSDQCHITWIVETYGSIDRLHSETTRSAIVYYHAGLFFSFLSRADLNSGACRG